MPSSDVRGQVRHRPCVPIYDVAARAEVSHQTVSRVINDRPGVAPHTRDAVLRAVHDLNFEARRAARALRSRQFTEWGVVVVGPPGAVGWSRLIGLQAAAAAAGVSLQIQLMAREDWSGGVDASHTLRGQGVDRLEILLDDEFLRPS